MGIVFDIARCSYQDGPGIRTAVFFKGCPQHCLWCHNPESLRPEPELEFVSSACTGCGRCEAVCPAGVHAFCGGRHILRRERCRLCGACVRQCPASALRMIGREMSAKEIIALALRDRAYCEASGGGITFTGGEPTLQPDFLAELLHLSQANGLHTAVETNGFCSEEVLRRILPDTDLFLLDCKLLDADALLRLTGGRLSDWMNSLKLLEEAGKEIILRLPVIPGINDTEAHFSAVAALLASHCFRSWEIMPYHDLGRSKWEGLGLEYSLASLPSVSCTQADAWHRSVADALSSFQA